MALPFILDQYAAIIAAGGSLSAAVPMGADTLAAIWMPTPWTAASLTFQVSPDGGTTWLELYDGAGNEITVQGAAGQFLMLANFPSYQWRGINNLKVRSGTAASPVVQSAGAIVTLLARPEMF